MENQLLKSDFLKIEEKRKFYECQYNELKQANNDLALAYKLVKPYSQAEAKYYFEMFEWMNSRYEFVIDYSFQYSNPF